MHYNPLVFCSPFLFIGTSVLIGTLNKRYLIWISGKSRIHIKQAVRATGGESNI